MFERFTQQAREVPVVAQAEARGLSHKYIGTEHLLLALLDPRCGKPAAILRQAGLDTDRVRADIGSFVGRGSQLGDADADALESIGIDLDAVKAKIEEVFGPGALDPTFREVRRGLFRRRRVIVRSGPIGGHIPFTPRSKKVLELSLREALRLKHNFIGSEHILLGLIREGEGLATKIMVEAGVDLDEVGRQAVAAVAKP